jgi:hypothetical protein
MNKMDRYTIVEGAGRHIHDMDQDCIIAHAISPEDAAHICAALNFVEDFQRDGVAKFRDALPDMRRAEWATYAAAALGGRCASAESWMEQLFGERILDACKHADAMMAEADRRFIHEA